MVFLLQEEALTQLKSSNPKGRFWIKIDGTDLKVALMHSMKGEWDGDADLGDGALQALKTEYEHRVADVAACLSNSQIQQEFAFFIAKCVESLQADIPFLDEGFRSAVQTYSDKYSNPNTPAETLKNCNWEVVEFQTLLQDAQALKVLFEDCLSVLHPDTATQRQMLTCKTLLKDNSSKVFGYLRNLYKKKRTAASHVEVIMVSDEKRATKPYALPVKFVPCTTLKDQYVRDLTKEVKEVMTERGLKVVGKYYIWKVIGEGGGDCTVFIRGTLRRRNVLC